MVGDNRDPSPDEKIAESAEAIEEQNQEVVEAVEDETAQQTGAADRRTELAPNRTVVAGDHLRRTGAHRAYGSCLRRCRAESSPAASGRAMAVPIATAE